jgi:hypothetical protein
MELAGTVRRRAALLVATVTAALALGACLPPEASSGNLRIDAVLAKLPYNPRLAGWSVVVGDDPVYPGHWGVTEAGSRTIYIGPNAFADDARLYMVVAHESAHAFIGGWSVAQQSRVLSAMPPGMNPNEAYADCQAILWGADPTVTAYWSCPEPYRRIVAAR